jgi:hypothetical protein
MTHQLTGLLARARELEVELAVGTTTDNVTAADHDARVDSARRLRDSVIRPLSDPPVVDDDRERPELQSATSPVSQRLWELARDATNLRIASTTSAQLQEAAAALQDLAIQIAAADNPEAGAARLAELEQLQADLPCSIQVSTDGPYLVTNAAR